ncbi:hypothetical protein NE865_08660 [Phthorimaea operculella]|nr:hypothetical protein NE865_08660 [Phthorimaea operculella]
MLLPYSFSVRDVWCRKFHEGHQNVGSRASELLKKNQESQDAKVNERRHPPRVYKLEDLVFVIKYSQSTGKLDPGMRGPYKVIRVLPNGRYELKLLSGGYGKTTQAAAQYMVPWRGEWCPESCAAFFEHDEEEDSGAGSPVAAIDPAAAPSTSSIGSTPASQVSVEDDELSGEAV